MFTLGIGLILATVTVFFRDLQHLYGVFVHAVDVCNTYILSRNHRTCKVQFNINLKPDVCYYRLFKDVIYGWNIV